MHTAGKKKAAICWVNVQWTSRWAIWTRVWRTATSATRNNCPVRCRPLSPARQPLRRVPVQPGRPVKRNRRHSPDADTRRTYGISCPLAGRSENCRLARRRRRRRWPRLSWPPSSTRRQYRRRPCMPRRRRRRHRLLTCSTRISIRRRCTRLPDRTTGLWPPTMVVTIKRISIRPCTIHGYRIWRPPTIYFNTGNMHSNIMYE